jgi:hypothetical protein
MCLQITCSGMCLQIVAVAQRPVLSAGFSHSVVIRPPLRKKETCVEMRSAFGSRSDAFTSFVLNVNANLPDAFGSSFTSNANANACVQFMRSRPDRGPGRNGDRSIARSKRSSRSNAGCYSCKNRNIPKSTRSSFSLPSPVMTTTFLMIFRLL